MSTPPDDAGPPAPRKLTEAKIEAVAAIILQGNFRQTAAKLVGVDPATLSRWMKLGRRYPDGLYGKLNQVVLRAEAAAEGRAVDAIMAAGRAGEVKYLCWWLERKFPQRWGRHRGELYELRRQVRELERLVRRTLDNEDGKPPDGLSGERHGR